MMINFTRFHWKTLFFAKAFGSKLLAESDGKMYHTKEFNAQVDFGLDFNGRVEAQIGAFTDNVWFCFGANVLDLVSAELAWTRQQDHPALVLELNLLLIRIRLEVRDLRHWDYENNKFKKIDEL